MEVVVPEGLRSATLLREGAAGRRWLEGLPDLVAAACRRWQCDLDGLAMHGEVALVVPVRRGGEPAVLKISFPHPGNLGEVTGLHAFDGRGAVRLLEADDSGFELLLERCRPLTLAEQVTNETCSVDEAIELAGDLARRLAVDAPPGTTRLADTGAAWADQLAEQVSACPRALPDRAIEQARETIELIGTDVTSTMLHGDLHFGNIMRADREPWLAIDPKGWSGTAAFDAFTVIAGGRERLARSSDPYAEIVRRVGRFAAAAQVDAALALSLSQARATSSYLYQQQVRARSWFDLEFLRCLALGRSTGPPTSAATRG